MVVKPRPACRHCGATLPRTLSRCPRCGKRTWSALLAGWLRRY